MAWSFHKFSGGFGSKVTVIQHRDLLMPREDRDVADAIKEFLIEEGVKFIFGAEVTEVARMSSGIAITIKVDGKKKIIEGF